MKPAISAFMALQAMEMLYKKRETDKPFEQLPAKVSNEWDGVHLSKAERKGKTYEELQELRRMKWEEGKL